MPPTHPTQLAHPPQPPQPPQPARPPAPPTRLPAQSAGSARPTPAHPTPASLLTLPDALDVAAGRHPDTPVVFPSQNETISLRDLAAGSRLLAGALVADGVEPGDRIGILAQNSAEFLLALFAVSRAGAACPLPLPTSAHDLGGYVARLARIVAVAGIRRVVTGGRLAGPRPGRRAAGRSTEQPAGVLGRLAGGLDGVRFLAVAELAASGGTARAAGAPVDLDDLAIVQFTSGSTAAPKGVALTHRNVAHGIAAIVAGVALGPDDHGGSWLPMFHDMGLFATLSAIMTGTPMTVWSPSAFVRDPARWLREFLAAGVSVSPAPNFAYDHLVEAVGRDEAAGLDLRRWRVALNGAEPVSAAGVERFLAHFAPAGFTPERMVPVYGMAEATLAVTFPPLGRPPVVIWVDRDRLAADGVVVAVGRDHPRAKGLVGVGMPVRGMQVRIADPAGDILADPRQDGLAPPLRVGEIQIQGGAVTSGYLTGRPSGRPTAAAQPDGAFTADGWLRTGDLGFLRDDELFVTGRNKEMIIVRGVNYYPQDAEQAVRDLPGLYRRRVVAFAGTGRSPGAAGAAGGPASSAMENAGGENITLVGETALADPADRARLAEDLRAAAVAALGLNEVAVHLVGPGALPRTSSGKFQRLAAGDLVRRGEL